MAYHINTDCISCGACAAECPVSAISEGDSIYVIDAVRWRTLGTYFKSISNYCVETALF